MRGKDKPPLKRADSPCQGEMSRRDRGGRDGGICEANDGGFLVQRRNPQSPPGGGDSPLFKGAWTAHPTIKDVYSTTQARCKPIEPPAPEIEESGSDNGSGVVPPPRRRRPHKLHIVRFRLAAKAHSFRCSSFPHATRFAGLARGPRQYSGKVGKAPFRNLRFLKTSLCFPWGRLRSPSGARRKC